MTSYESHILRIISPLDTQSVTSAGKKLDFMSLPTSDRPLMNLRSGHPTCSTWRALMCLFVLAATAAEHNSRTSQLSHLTVTGERRRKWLHSSSLWAFWPCLQCELLFPRKYFSQLSTQCLWGSCHLCQAQMLISQMQGKHLLLWTSCLSWKSP